jgi:hypothetical protein
MSDGASRVGSARALNNPVRSTTPCAQLPTALSSPATAQRVGTNGRSSGGTRPETI